VREQTKARAALVIVIGGTLGDGFACQSDLQTVMHLPELLEKVAADIRTSRDAKIGQAG
jgi:hypothetical protein